MSKIERFLEWTQDQARMSSYLSKKENWTPMLKMVSRQFLLVGFVLGAMFGTWIMFVLMGGLR